MSSALRARWLHLAVGALLVLSTARIGRAQSLQLAVADSASSRAARRDVLLRSIALRLNDVPVEQALRTVAALGGTRLAYASDLLPPDVRVTLSRERIALGDAFREVLRDEATRNRIRALGMRPADD